MRGNFAEMFQRNENRPEMYNNYKLKPCMTIHESQVCDCTRTLRYSMYVTLNMLHLARFLLHIIKRMLNDRSTESVIVCLPETGFIFKP